MPFKFNTELWNLGKKIEDAILPELNETLECNLQRSDNIFDIMDFRDEDKKIAVEVKGRRIKSDRYEDTIITTGKIVEGWKLVEDGWDVYYVFVFTDKVLHHKLTGEEFWRIKMTGTNHIEHYLIPVNQLKEFQPEPIPE
tara:strand:- start:537 stop:956 length:420 start_codon:yes stop_codon:yes gene_type:complete